MIEMKVDKVGGAIQRWVEVARCGKCVRVAMKLGKGSLGDVGPVVGAATGRRDQSLGEDVRVGAQRENVWSLLLLVGQTSLDEHLGLHADGRLGGELNLPGLQDGVLLQDARLRQVVAKRLQTPNQ